MNGATNSETSGTSLAIQWLRLHTSTAGGVGLILGQRTKILYATEHNQKKKKTPPPPTTVHISNRRDPRKDCAVLWKTLEEDNKTSGTSDG